MTENQTSSNRFAKLSYLRSKEEERDLEDSDEEQEDENGDQEETVSRDVDDVVPEQAECEESAKTLSYSFTRLNCQDKVLVQVVSPRPCDQVVSSKGPMNASPTQNQADRSRSNNRLSYRPPISREVNKLLAEKLKRQSSSPGSPRIPTNPAADFQVGGAAAGSQLYNQWLTSRWADDQTSQDRCNRDTGLIRLTRAGNNEGMASYLANLANSYRLPIEVNTANACYLTPLAIAVYQENEFAIQLLIKHGADPGKRLSLGNNCFHIVADSDVRGMCLMQLVDQSRAAFSQQELEAKLNATNMFNASPIDILYLRLRTAMDPQQRQVLDQMIQYMTGCNARPNMNHTFLSSMNQGITSHTL